MLLPLGTTSFSPDVMLVDDTGHGIANATASQFPPVYIAREGSALETVNLHDLDSVDDPFSAGGVFPKGGGAYRLDIPNSVGAIAGRVRVFGDSPGKVLLLEVLEIRESTGVEGSARNVTVTVQNAGEGIQNAVVRLSQAGATRAIKLSDEDGIAELSVNNGTFTISVTADGFLGFNDSIEVSGDTEIDPIDLTPITIPTSSDPGVATAYIRLKEGTEPAVGATIFYRIADIPGETGIGYNLKTKTSPASDSNGLITFPVFKGFTYQFWWESGNKRTVIVPADGDTFAIPNLDTNKTP